LVDLARPGARPGRDRLVGDRRVERDRVEHRRLVGDELREEVEIRASVFGAASVPASSFSGSVAAVARDDCASVDSVSSDSW